MTRGALAVLTLALAGGLLLLAGPGCGGWEPRPYCSETVPCPEGLVCHKATYTCFRGRWDLGPPDARPDQGVDRRDLGLDLEQGAHDISSTYENK